MKLRWVLLGAIGLCGLSALAAEGPAANQQAATKPSAIAPAPIYKVTSPPMIDGALDEACWRQARPVVANYLFAGDGKQTDPAPLVARFAWDEHYFYIGYEVRDTDLVTIDTGRETGPPGNRRPTSEEYAPEKNLDLVEFYVSLGNERAFWEVHHTAANQMNNLQIGVPPAEVLAKVARPSIKDLAIKRDGYIADDGPFTVARAVQLKRRTDGSPGALNKGDGKDTGYTGEIRLPWAGLGMPASRRRVDGTYDLAGMELPLLAVVLNGNGGKVVYNSSGPGLPKLMFHFSANQWPRYVLREQQ